MILVLTDVSRDNSSISRTGDTTEALQSYSVLLPVKPNTTPPAFYVVLSLRQMCTVNIVILVCGNPFCLFVCLCTWGCIHTVIVLPQPQDVLIMKSRFIIKVTYLCNQLTVQSTPPLPFRNFHNVDYQLSYSSFIHFHPFVVVDDCLCTGSPSFFF